MTTEAARAATFATTADMGIRARAATREDLFRAAGEALCSAMVDRRTVRPAHRRRLRIAAGDTGAMMVEWLNQLIFLFEVEGFLARRISVRAEGAGLAASLVGETLDASRHRLGTVFKAATLHRLCVEERDGRWRARVVLDV